MPTALSVHRTRLSTVKQDEVCGMDRLRRLGIAYRAFYEPDRGNELTAVGTEPVCGERRQVFKGYRCLSQPGFR